MTFAPSLSPRTVRSPTLVGVGGVAWSGDPAVIYSTLLGSCIAVCLWDPVAGKGGMNHFLLAEAPSEGSTDTRYGAVSLPLLRQNLCAVGCHKSRLKAIVAGGSDLLSNMRAIGTENARFALNWLAEDGIVVEREDIGSTRARRVRFSPSTGVCEIIHVQSPPVEVEVNRPATAS